MNELEFDRLFDAKIAQKLGEGFEFLFLRPHTEEPERIFEGMIILVDTQEGTGWDPLSTGNDFYLALYTDSNAWVDVSTGL